MGPGRRSFLAVALAWIASAVALALAWPRRALALASPSRGFTPPTAPARPDVRRFSAYREPDPAEEVRSFEDLRQLLDEMHAHVCTTGHSVLSSDDPERRRIGFFTWGREGELKVTWQIPLTLCKGLDSVPASFGDHGDPAAALRTFHELLCSSEGRRRLAKAYQEGAQLRHSKGLGPLPESS
jgi:hypothetical protein